jgi:hypothetical protein
MASQTSCFENYFSETFLKGFLNGASASIIACVLPDLIPINPAISAVFIATMTAGQEFSKLFFNYCLEKMGCTKESDYYVFFSTDMLAASIGLSLAFRITAVALNSIQLLSLWFLSICGGALLYYMIVPDLSINAKDSSVPAQDAIHIENDIILV